jgi:hypothetical protein
MESQKKSLLIEYQSKQDKVEWTKSLENLRNECQIKFNFSDQEKKKTKFYIVLPDNSDLEISDSTIFEELMQSNNIRKIIIRTDDKKNEIKNNNNNHFYNNKDKLRDLNHNKMKMNVNYDPQKYYDLSIKYSELENKYNELKSQFQKSQTEYNKQLQEYNSRIKKLEQFILNISKQNNFNNNYLTQEIFCEVMSENKTLSILKSQISNNKSINYKIQIKNLGNQDISNCEIIAETNDNNVKIVNSKINNIIKIGKEINYILILLFKDINKVKIGKYNIKLFISNSIGIISKITSISIIIKDDFQNSLSDKTYEDTLLKDS